MVVATTILLQLFSKPLLCFYSFRGQFCLTFLGWGKETNAQKNFGFSGAAVVGWFSLFYLDFYYSTARHFI